MGKREDALSAAHHAFGACEVFSQAMDELLEQMERSGMDGVQADQLATLQADAALAVRDGSQVVARLFTTITRLQRSEEIARMKAKP